ncbi:hypothetical protein A3K72_03175, partial [Candidatus Woesearchaeota archaeon RBG_13_36_6]
MSKTIKLDHITKIEGHARLHVVVDDGKLQEVEMGAFEGARFFEGLIIGRKYYEVPIITSRICGICSCIHVTASVQAIEDAFGVKVSEQTKLLRELVVLGERLRSHASHLYLFALPDYLGFESALAMAPKHKEEVNRALELIKLGNNIVIAIGGREMHPVAGVVGGFTRIPDKKELGALLNRLKKQKKDAIKTVELFSKLKYPKFDRQTQYFALYDKGYSTISGDVRSFDHKIKPKTYKEHITEVIKEYSTAKFSTINGKSFMTGALARVNNNHDTMSKDTKKLIKQLKLNSPIYNPFYNNLCQAIELVNHFDRAIEILRNLKLKEEKPVKVKPKTGRGIAAVEAPRGLLFHDYEFDKDGKLIKANIITPTAQNLNN